MTHFDRTLLIHVAAESEQRGRVVLASRTAAPSTAAIGAAFAVAAAFETRVDCLLIESPDIFVLTQHQFARGVSFSGRIAPLTKTAIAEAQTAATASARAAVVAAGKRSNVRVETSVARDGLQDALSRACALEGPWNILALAEPVQSSDGRWLYDLLCGVNGATGVVCVGPAALSSPASGGPVVAVVEDMDRLPQMLRAAERLAHRPGRAARAVHLLVAGETAARTTELDGHLRLLLSDVPADPKAQFVFAESGIAHGTPSEIAEALRRQNGHVVIARCGGIALPSNGDAAPLLGAVASPLLLVR